MPSDIALALPPRESRRFMRVFLYESITGGGSLDEAFERLAASSLLCEASAMVRALAEDFAAVEGIETTVLRDARFWPKAQK